MIKKFLEQIQELKDKDLYRELMNCNFINSIKIKYNNKKLICFSSNDYLGLADNKKVKSAAIKAIKKYGSSARSSRYICGNNSLYQKLEEKTAQINKCEKALVFSSGYQTAIGLIPAISTKNDLIIADKLIHSSLVDGCKLSGAKFIRFSHNNIYHAQKLLEQYRGNYNNCIIVSEKIFSMDGDAARIRDLNNLSQKFNCQLLIDYAHDLYIDQNNMNRDIIKMGTFSKAAGSFGGYVCANKEIIEYLSNYARSNIYTTALPPSVLAASLKSLQIISTSNLGQKSLSNAQYFCNLMNLPQPESAIIIIKTNSSANALQIKEKMIEKGFFISAIRPPTVLTPRLRITFSAKHTKLQIRKLANYLKELQN